MDLIGAFMGQMLGGANMQQGGMGMGPRQSVFDRKFIPLTPAYWQTEDPTKLESGDKIVLPPSALDQLSKMNIQFPIMFEITNTNTGKISHCSVLEFTAPEGRAYLPLWMFDNLQMDPNSTTHNRVRLRNVPLQKGSYVKLQPHTTSFTELANPRAMLEVALRGFSCLTKGDTIQIAPKNLGQKFSFDVIEVKPATQVSIIETDINVDFAPPKDYEKHQKEAALKKVQEAEARKKKAAPAEEEKNAADAGDKDSEDELLGGLFDSAGAKPQYRKKTTKQPSYWSKRSDGQKLNGKPIKNRGCPLGGSPGAKKKKKVEEIVGNMRYIYEVDETTGEKTVIRRLPMRKLPAGSGKSLKG